MKEHEGSIKGGVFKLSSGLDVPGELVLRGASTTLKLYADEQFDTHASTDITGRLHDRSKVSLIDCITTSGPGSGTRAGDRYYFSTVFPHLVAFGDQHITSDDHSIRHLSFVVDDGVALFYDFNAFGRAINARSHMERIAEERAQNTGRQIKVGDHPEVFFFTGQHEIVSVDTALGEISATHGGTWTSPSPAGLRIGNAISINLYLKEDQTVRHALACVIDMVRFLELIAGRPQNRDRPVRC